MWERKFKENYSSSTVMSGEKCLFWILLRFRDVSCLLGASAGFGRLWTFTQRQWRGEKVAFGLWLMPKIFFGTQSSRQHLQTKGNLFPGCWNFIGRFRAWLVGNLYFGRVEFPLENEITLLYLTVTVGSGQSYAFWFPLPGSFFYLNIFCLRVQLFWLSDAAPALIEELFCVIL